MSFSFRAMLLIALLTMIRTDDNMEQEEASTIATQTLDHFLNLYLNCISINMHNQFIMDDIFNFVHYPSKTTVGLAPKFTKNRKFFANMVSTTAFKEMLVKDEDELRKSFIAKLKFCDEAILDPRLLKDFYLRDVDQTKV